MEVKNIHPFDLHVLLNNTESNGILDILLRSDGLIEIPKGGQVYCQTINALIETEEGKKLNDTLRN